MLGLDWKPQEGEPFIFLLWTVRRAFFCLRSALAISHSNIPELVYFEQTQSI